MKSPLPDPRMQQLAQQVGDLIAKRWLATLSKPRANEPLAIADPDPKSAEDPIPTE